MYNPVSEYGDFQIRSYIYELLSIYYYYEYFNSYTLNKFDSIEDNCYFNFVGFPSE